MRILEAIIVILVLSSAIAWITYYYSKSSRKPPCGHCCGNLKKFKDRIEQKRPKEPQNEEKKDKD